MKFTNIVHLENGRVEFQVKNKFRNEQFFPKNKKNPDMFRGKNGFFFHSLSHPEAVYGDAPGMYVQGSSFLGDNPEMNDTPVEMTEECFKLACEARKEYNAKRGWGKK